MPGDRPGGYGAPPGGQLPPPPPPHWHGGGPPGPFTAGGGPPPFPPPPTAHPPPAPQQHPLWTEHRAKDGRTYWFNRATRKSSWEKPEALGGSAGVGVDGAGPGGGDASVSSAAAAALAATPWREVKAPDGRPYFYNRDTKKSVWVCPPELKAAREAAAAAAAASRPAGPAGGLAPPGSVLPGAAEAAALAATAAREGRFMYATKADAKAAFCELLTAVGARSTDAWEAVLPSIQADPRFAALKSNGERKACFTEFQAAAAKKEAAAARAAREAARDAFTAFLASAGLDASTAKFSDAERGLGADPRWRLLDAAIAAATGAPSVDAVSSAARREKEGLFADWVRGAQRAARDAARAARDAAAEELSAWYERRGWVTSTTRWRDAEPRLDAEAAGDPAEHNPHAAADRPTRLAAFSKLVRRLWAAEDGERARAEAARARAERRARDAFRAVLAAAAASGSLAPRTRWREFRAKLLAGGEAGFGGFGGRPASFAGAADGPPAAGAALEALEAAPAGPTPRDLFVDALLDVEAKFATERAALLEAAVRGAGLSVPQAVAGGTSPTAAGDLAALRVAFDDAAEMAGGPASAASAAVRDLVWAEVVGKAAAGEALVLGEDPPAGGESEGEGDRRRRRRRGRSPSSDRSGDRHHRGSRRRRDGERDRRGGSSRRAESDEEEGEL